MQKVFAKCLIAAVCAVVLAGSASAQRLPGGSSSKGQNGWVILTYTDDGLSPYPQPVTSLKGGGVSFDFYNTPDRAVLINDVTNNKQFKPGTLTGKSLSARIAISATTGATFNYFVSDGSGTGTSLGNWASVGGFVRLYFQRPNDTAYIDPTSGYTCGDSSIFDATKPRCEAQYWWSNPVHVELADLLAAGSKGLVLQVSLDPALWSDRMGTMGDANADATAWFNDAVTNANKLGLSFGGDGGWAFGVGVNNGPSNPGYHSQIAGGPAKATFQLISFGSK